VEQPPALPNSTFADRAKRAKKTATTTKAVDSGTAENKGVSPGRAAKKASG
jgi:hypothetical protein